VSVAQNTQVVDSAGGAAAAPSDGAGGANVEAVSRPAVGFAHALVSRAGCEPGAVKTNQDAVFVLTDWAPAGKATLVGVLDGHGPFGHNVSSFLRNAFPAALASQSDALATGDAHGALQSAFATCDEQLNKAGIDCDFSGSTAVVALLDVSGRITCAWTGDSRMVVGRRDGGPDDGSAGAEVKSPRRSSRGAASKWNAVPLTFDHKPDSPGEVERIKKAGGRVEQLVDERGRRVGPHRVWLRTSWTPGLAMSRALGDVVAHRAGVTSLPDVSVHRLEACDEIIIAATDGLWEFIDNDEAVRLASKHDTPAAACAALAAEAAARWIKEEDGVCDDITIVVFFLGSKRTSK
jgi:serine/threonine protein phosphatase PrpC